VYDRVEAVRQLAAEARQPESKGSKSNFKQLCVRGFVYDHTKLEEYVVVLASAQQNTASHTNIPTSATDRIFTLFYALNAYNASQPADKKIVLADVTHQEANKLMSLGKEGTGSRVAASVYNAFHFMQNYGPDALDQQLLEKGSASAPLRLEWLAELIKPVSARKQWLPTAAQLEKLKQDEPTAFVGVPSLAKFLNQRLIFCRDQTLADKQAQGGKVDKDKSTFFSTAGDASTIGQMGVAVWVMWIRVNRQSHTASIYLQLICGRATGKKKQICPQLISCRVAMWLFCVALCRFHPPV
jgi:hypothetical protein